MTGDRLSQAQAFWNKTKAVGWSDEQTRMQARREAGIVQHGANLIFSDGSILSSSTAAFGRKLVVRERASLEQLRKAASAR